MSQDGPSCSSDFCKTWGDFNKGRLLKVTDEQVRAIVSMKAKGEKIARIARTVNLSRITIYRVLERHQQGHMETATA